jgi:hypothetical protein
MAKLTKSRARKPLCEGEVSFSNSGTQGGREYGLSMATRNDEGDILAYFNVKLSSAEALRFAGLIAGGETHDPFESGYFVVDNRKPWEKLRALADKLEREA